LLLSDIVLGTDGGEEDAEENHGVEMADIDR